MISRREMLKASLAAVGTSAFCKGAIGQGNWPAREIHSICMFPPGGGADLLARFYSKKLQEAVGKPVIVETKVGAFGNIATEYVARSKPDGYTIYPGPGNLLAIAPHIYNKLSFDPVNDFEHVTTLFKIPFVLLVASNSPHKSVSDLVTDLKQKGNKGSYGSISTTSIIAAELLKQQFGLETVEVKYKDQAQGFLDMIGGNISFIITDTGSASGQISSGRLRPLALTTPERAPVLPNVLGSDEAGLKNMNLFSWWSLHTPKGTPEPILETLETTFNKINQDADTQKVLFDAGAVVLPGDRKLAKELIVNGIKDFGEYVKLAKIERT